MQETQVEVKEEVMEEVMEKQSAVRNASMNSRFDDAEYERWSENLRNKSRSKNK